MPFRYENEKYFSPTKQDDFSDAPSPKRIKYADASPERPYVDDYFYATDSRADVGLSTRGYSPASPEWTADFQDIEESDDDACSSSDETIPLSDVCPKRIKYADASPERPYVDDYFYATDVQTDFVLSIREYSPASPDDAENRGYSPASPKWTAGSHDITELESVPIIAWSPMPGDFYLTSECQSECSEDAIDSLSTVYDPDSDEDANNSISTVYISDSDEGTIDLTESFDGELSQ